MWKWLIVGVTLAGAACISSKAQCLRSNCNGCCDTNGDCQVGTDDSACGAFALACQVCAPGGCQNGSCAGGSTDGGHGDGGMGSCASSCTGCCDTTGSCKVGTANNSCGKNGAACTVCSGTCTSGSCGACTGCLDLAGHCQPGNQPNACGKGGANCGACGAGYFCTNGACMQQSCGPSNCPAPGSGMQACCNTANACVPAGSNNNQCGSGGSACTACINGEICNPQGQCFSPGSDGGPQPDGGGGGTDCSTFGFNCPGTCCTFFLPDGGAGCQPDGPTNYFACGAGNQYCGICNPFAGQLACTNGVCM